MSTAVLLGVSVLGMGQILDSNTCAIQWEYIESSGQIPRFSSSANNPNDQSVLFSGNHILKNISYSGGLAWTRSYNSDTFKIDHSVLSDISGLIYMGNTTYGTLYQNTVAGQIGIAKLDENGDVLLKRPLLGNGNEIINSFTKINDQSFLISGITTSTDSDFSSLPNLTGSYGFLIKMDADLNIIWLKKYPLVQEITSFSSTTLSNGNLLIRKVGSGEQLLLNANADLIQTINNPIENVALKPTNDGGWIVINGPELLKYNALGVQQWAWNEYELGSTNPTARFFVVGELIQTLDGGYMVVGSNLAPTTSGEGRRLAVCKLNANGTTVYFHKFNLALSMGHFREIVQINTNDFILGGEYWDNISQYSKAIAVRYNSTTCNLTSIEEQSFQTLLTYPNPATDVVNFSAQDGSLIYELELIDLSGRSVQNEVVNAEQAQIKVNHLSKGLYMYKGITKKGQIVGRVSVQ